MSSPTLKYDSIYHALPHRVAVCLVCVVFPLIWVGGLVTTYDAGMAVPDWPGTYGYNLFLYPWTTWLAGPWNLFIEHGHRLLGAFAGLITLLFAAAVFRYDTRLSMRFLAQLAVALVVFQGVLGGQRVLLNARSIALVHGCVGPLYFAFCAMCCVLTSRTWYSPPQLQSAGNLTRASFLGLILMIVQLVLGAMVRHPADDTSPYFFRSVLFAHLFLGAGLVAHLFILAWSVRRQAKEMLWLERPATRLILLACGQMVLGFASLIVKYGWPQWLGGEWFAADFTVQAKSFWSAMILTAHVANGSLILAHLAVLWLRCLRVTGWGLVTQALSAKALGVAI
jgi:heme a synthase